MLNGLLTSYKENRKEDQAFYFHLLHEFLYVKNESWKHENEFRIVANAVDDKQDDKQCKGKNISNSKLGIKPVRVVAGYQCSSDNKTRLRDICNKLGIRFSYATVSENSYEFEVKNDD